MSQKLFDAYTFKARVIPALIVLLPFGLALASLFPKKFVGWDVLVWLLSNAGLAFFLEQFARDLGKRKELKLFSDWGGKPTSLLLSHSKSSLSTETINRYHFNLSEQFGIITPTKEVEAKDPEFASQLYDSCIDFLEANTREVIKFPLVVKENANYGFRRNLLGMKFLAIIIAVISIGLLVIPIFLHWNSLKSVSIVIFVSLLIDIALLAIWIFIVTKKWVKTAAFAYAKILLQACDVLKRKTEK